MPATIGLQIKSPTFGGHRERGQIQQSGVSRNAERKSNYRLATAERQAEMNVLPKEKQVQILNALVEGCSVRATARLVGVEHKTVLRVLRRAGDRCAQILDEKMWTKCTALFSFVRRI